MSVCKFNIKVFVNITFMNRNSLPVISVNIRYWKYRILPVRDQDILLNEIWFLLFSGFCLFFLYYYLKYSVSGMPVKYRLLFETFGFKCFCFLILLNEMILFMPLKTRFLKHSKRWVFHLVIFMNSPFYNSIFHLSSLFHLVIYINSNSSRWSWSDRTDPPDRIRTCGIRVKSPLPYLLATGGRCYKISVFDIFVFASSLYSPYENFC